MKQYAKREDGFFRIMLRKRPQGDPLQADTGGGVNERQKDRLSCRRLQGNPLSRRAGEWRAFLKEPAVNRTVGQILKRSGIRAAFVRKQTQNFKEMKG